MVLCYNKICNEFFLGREEKMKTREDTRMVKLDFNFFKLAFWNIH